MLRRGLIAVALASSLQPGVPLAAPAAKQKQKEAGPDLAAVDRAFRFGQDEFDAGRYLDAARVWNGAANLLPETEEHRENRQTIHEHIAEAYEKAIAAEMNEDVMRQGLTLLDAYADAFTAAYPSVSPSEPVTRTRLGFRTRLKELARQRQQLAGPSEPPAPVAAVPPPPHTRSPTKPWIGLAIGGGVAVGGGVAMLGLFAAGFVRAKAAEAEFDDPANACVLAAPAANCRDISSQGKTANAVAVAGLVAAPLLLGTGIALLVIASRRKSRATALAPLLSPNMAGILWQQRF